MDEKKLMNRREKMVTKSKDWARFVDNEKKAV